MLVLAAEKMDRGRGRKENMQRPKLMNEKLTIMRTNLKVKSSGGFKESSVGS